MSRILVAECKQEISSFNPVIGTYDNFSVRRGPELLTYHQGRETELCGALQVFSDSHVDVIPTYGAVAPSAGPLDQQDFERIAADLLDAVTPHLADADGMYFCLHGAMGCTEELDPEGYLLQEIPPQRRSRLPHRDLARPSRHPHPPHVGTLERPRHLSHLSARRFGRHRPPRRVTCSSKSSPARSP